MHPPPAPPSYIIPDWSPTLREEDLTRAQKVALWNLPVLLRTQVILYMRHQAALRAAAEAQAAEAAAEAARAAKRAIVPILVGALLGFLARPVQKAIAAFWNATAYAPGSKYKVYWALILAAPAEQPG